MHVNIKQWIETEIRVEYRKELSVQYSDNISLQHKQCSSDSLSTGLEEEKEHCRARSYRSTWSD